MSTYNVVFYLAVGTFLIVLAFWVWATSGYIRRSEQLATLRGDDLIAMKESLTFLQRISTNPTILGTILTSACTAVFSLLKSTTPH